ncbi:unnamed protein product [Allacma fusca]|uniref:Sorting nexin-2 n=1 Tax=Allacma fusca TaxID=39272 RepID=A0A8J2JDU8_9HEXA|nr:unnamed protein product [Allacma fusca]
MSEEKATDFDFRGKIDDDDDIFKSAVESPMTDTDRTLHGDDEIDLNDDDDLDLDDVVQQTISVNIAENVHGENESTIIGEEGQQNQTRPYVSDSPPQAPTRSASTIGADDRGSTNNETMKTVDNEKHFVEITVTEPQRQGEGMSSFLVYRVTTRTNIALFRRKEFAVWRRFSDFLGLHAKLEEKYLRKGRIVPPAPEKNILGTTKIKISNQNEGQGVNTDFIEKRRAGLERFLVRTASHSVLCIDPDFREFLESDSDLPRSTSTSAFSGAGMVRLFSKFGETVNKISYRMDESDPWFEEKIQNIEALENQLRKVHTSIEVLVINRKESAQSTGSFAKSAAILSNSDEHDGLARALAKLAELEEQIEQIQNDQANSDFFLFSELLKDYIGLIGSVKEVFHERVKAYQTWQHAQQVLSKKREAKSKLELQVKNDRIAQAREEVIEWEGKVERYQEDFESISRIIKKELDQFEVARVKEFKKIIIKYLESQLKHQEELVKYWEAFLPEAKAIS